MTPEQAWQAAVVQLQTEMTKATFDKWVRDARFLSFKDGDFTVGVLNAYVRDWLESRLTSTFSRILTGIMNQNADVHFVVQPYEAQNDRGGQQKETSSAFAIPFRELSDEQIEILYLSIRDEIVRPERVVVIPGYFKRWLPYLGPTLSWMIVAFRQILYLRSGGDFRIGVPFSAAWSELCKWSGLSRATIGRHKNDPMLGWFLTQIEQDQKWEIDSQTGRPKQKPSLYRFIASMPMTPGDQDTLYERLINTGLQEDPVATLEQLIRLQPNEILPYPSPVPEPDRINRLPTPRSPQDVIRIACGNTKNELNHEINQLADRLAGRLMPPTDNIVITHYFLQNHVSELGAGPAWMITLLRDDIYYNSETGELRDIVWLSGGYQEIANRIGLSRHRTVSEWLPPVFERTRQNRGKNKARRRRRARTREKVSQYLEIVDHQMNGQGQLSLKFRVDLSEPFTLVDQALYKLSFEIFNAYLSTNAETLVEKVLGWNDTSKDAYETLITGIQDAFETLEDAFETQKGAPKTRLSLLKHLIKHLRRNHNNLNPPTTTLQANRRPSDENVVVGDGQHLAHEWNFEKLLQIGGFDPEKIPFVLKGINDPPVGRRFIAWCLYGYANKTSKDRQGVDAPILFAVSRYHKSEPDPDYLELAQKSPDRLAQMINSFHTPGLTRNQRQILSNLQSNGFSTLLQALSE